MKTSDYVEFTMNKFPRGYVFTYRDFFIEVDKKEAVIKALNRMVAAGKLSKISKGKYYKPEQTPFGELIPDQKQIVKNLLEEDGKIVGYLTGFSIYNQLGLTTQVSNTLQIGKNHIRPAFKRERYNISFVKQANTITKDNIRLLQLLDTIRYIKKIPDTRIEDACARLLKIFAKLSEKEVSTMIRLALKYPPSTRALLGAILDELGNSEITDPLFRSLNPITKYNLPGVRKTLAATDKWNIE